MATRIKNGYLALQEIYGDTISHKNEIALMVFQGRGFSDYATKSLARSGVKWDKDVWLIHYTIHQFQVSGRDPAH